MSRQGTEGGKLVSQIFMIAITNIKYRIYLRFNCYLYSSKRVHDMSRSEPEKS